MKKQLITGLIFTLALHTISYANIDKIDISAHVLGGINALIQEDGDTTNKRRGFDYAANINFVAFSKFNGMNIDGHIFSLMVIVLAAAEAAVALAIIINIYNNMNTINIDDAAELKR